MGANLIDTDYIQEMVNIPDMSQFNSKENVESNDQQNNQQASSSTFNPFKYNEQTSASSSKSTDVRNRVQETVNKISSKECLLPVDFLKLNLKNVEKITLKRRMTFENLEKKFEDDIQTGSTNYIKKLISLKTDFEKNAMATMKMDEILKMEETETPISDTIHTKTPDLTRMFALSLHAKKPVQD